MSNLEKLYLGTWQFADISEPMAIKLIETAQEVGIHNFDTARVYAEGTAERLLGAYCPDNATIVTKIPSLDKNAPTVAEAYPIDYVMQQTEASITALGRLPDSFLLHNWRPQWEREPCDVVASLRERIKSYGVSRFGISLPNSYRGNIESATQLALIDDIELPFNRTTPDMDDERIRNLGQGKNILARSLFLHGEDTVDIAGKVKNALATDAYLVMGATTPHQIINWKEIIQL